MRKPLRWIALMGTAACAALAGCRTSGSMAPPASAQPSGAPATASSTRVPSDSFFAGRIRGSASAPLTVYELSDFQCPFCRRFVTESWAALDSEYVIPGKVRWIFVNAPMPRIHPNSTRAAQYATCARRQGRFWPMHDLLFARQADWVRLSPPDSALGALAAAAGLNPARLSACLADPATAAELAHDGALVASLGFRGAPSFAANGQIVVLGAQPVDSFRVTLDRLLKR